MEMSQERQPGVHLVNMVVNVLFNDSGIWLDFISPVVEE